MQDGRSSRTARRRGSPRPELTFRRVAGKYFHKSLKQSFVAVNIADKDAIGLMDVPSSMRDTSIASKP
jgi:hypothetical protein